MFCWHKYCNHHRFNRYISRWHLIRPARFHLSEWARALVRRGIELFFLRIPPQSAICPQNRLGKAWATYGLKLLFHEEGNILEEDSLLHPPRAPPLSPPRPLALLSHSLPACYHTALIDNLAPNQSEPNWPQNAAQPYLTPPTRDWQQLHLSSERQQITR